MKKLFCLAAAAACICYGCTQDEENRNLGIGVYPGNPDENTAPVMVQDDSYRNIALNRAAYASSSFDYNLTAQLVTDGIVSAAAVIAPNPASLPVAPCGMERLNAKTLAVSGPEALMVPDA